MKTFIKQYKYELLSAPVVLGLWFLAAAYVPRIVLDLLAYWCLGYYWLGDVVGPWVIKQFKRVI
jgi:hypothetical protein